MESFLPNLSSHLKQLDVPLALASQPWFLCLFIGYVPLEVKKKILVINNNLSRHLCVFWIGFFMKEETPCLVLD